MIGFAGRFVEGFFVSVQTTPGVLWGTGLCTGMDRYRRYRRIEEAM
jgi:hypothetical protein